MVVLEEVNKRLRPIGLAVIEHPSSSLVWELVSLVEDGKVTEGEPDFWTAKRVMTLHTIGEVQTAAMAALAAAANLEELA